MTGAASFARWEWRPHRPRVATPPRVDARPPFARARTPMAPAYPFWCGRSPSVCLRMGGCRLPRIGVRLRKDRLPQPSRAGECVRAGARRPSSRPRVDARSDLSHGDRCACAGSGVRGAGVEAAGSESGAVHEQKSHAENEAKSWNTRGRDRRRPDKERAKTPTLNLTNKWPELLYRS